MLRLWLFAVAGLFCNVGLMILAGYIAVPHRWEVSLVITTIGCMALAACMTLEGEEDETQEIREA